MTLREAWIQLLLQSGCSFWPPLLNLPTGPHSPSHRTGTETYRTACLLGRWLLRLRRCGLLGRGGVQRLISVLDPGACGRISVPQLPGGCLLRREGGMVAGVGMEMRGPAPASQIIQFWSVAGPHATSFPCRRPPRHLCLCVSRPTMAPTGGLMFLSGFCGGLLHIIN